VVRAGVRNAAHCRRDLGADGLSDFADQSDKNVSRETFLSGHGAKVLKASSPARLELGAIAWK
jgi:hypothetical protein